MVWRFRERESERERGRDRGRKALSYAIQLHSLGLLVHSPRAFVCAVHVRVCVSFNMNLLRLPNI